MPAHTQKNPLSRLLPPLTDTPCPPPPAPRPVPDDATVIAWWDRHEMIEHIRRHSAMVAKVAHHVALMGAERGVDVDPDRVRLAGLLHDISKTYSVRFGGNHCQTGAAWTLELTGDILVAHCVHHHVYWPFEVDVRRHFAPLAVLYADKRVAHTAVVGIMDRYEDLLERYGTTEQVRERIRETRRQALDIEERLSQLLGEDLHACTFDRGRLVV